MIAVKKHGVILQKTDLVFENAGVLNPAVIRDGHSVHLFYRAVRKGNYSTVGYCRLDGPLEIVDRYDLPVLFPQEVYESHGVEDPRITQIDGLYYMTYTVYDGVNALGAYATAKVLPIFEKKGIITPTITYADFTHLAETKRALNEKYARFNAHVSLTPHTAETKDLLWDKNVVFFPRRINGKIFFLHRIKPDIQIACVDELDQLTKAYWDNYFMHFYENVAMEPRYAHEISYIGGGCPPIHTDHGWLLIYHGVHDTVAGYKYVACAALLDLENPCKEISRLPYPLFSPEFDYETNGEVNNVCFATGTALFDDELYIYYGAADEQIAVASLSFSALVEELLHFANAEIKPEV